MTLQCLNGSASLRCEPFAGTLDDWGEVLATFSDREIFQTPAWIRFLAESQGAEPVVLTLKDGGEAVGYFAGLIARKAGLRILGSPFVGWSTERMGFRLLPGVSRRAAIMATANYAYKELGCAHIELTDRNIVPADLIDTGFRHVVYRSSAVDLTPDEDVIYSRMSSKSCRYCIRKAQRLGVVIEEAHDEQFADEYYAQLCDVFAKQSLVPTYRKQRVQSLIRHLMPTGNLLLLRAREPQGRCIATGIFLGMHETAYFWGNASWRQDQHFCPNEMIHWYGMRYWKQRGIRNYDLCGGGLYKRKYGSHPVESYRLWKSKYRWIGWARTLAEKWFSFHRRAAGLRKKRRRDETEEDAQCCDSQLHRPVI